MKLKNTEINIEKSEEKIDGLKIKIKLEKNNKEEKDC